MNEQQLAELLGVYGTVSLSLVIFIGVYLLLWLQHPSLSLSLLRMHKRNSLICRSGSKRSLSLVLTTHALIYGDFPQASITLLKVRFADALATLLKGRKQTTQDTHACTFARHRGMHALAYTHWLLLHAWKLLRLINEISL